MEKTMLIFGGSDGIGLATAKKFIENGYRVYNASRTPCPVPSVINIKCDVTAEAEISDAVELVKRQVGCLDVLIYCAGFSMAAPIEYADERDWRYLFEVNFFGAMKAVRECIPLLKNKGGGHIFLISSVGGVVPIAFDGFYSSSKAALNMLAYEANLELNPYNIRVTSVMPGGTSTSFSFKRKITAMEKEQGYPSMPDAVDSLYRTEQTGRSADSVAATIFSAVGKNKIIVASSFINKLYHLAARLLPYRIILAVCRKKYF